MMINGELWGLVKPRVSPLLWKGEGSFGFAVILIPRRLYTFPVYLR